MSSNDVREKFKDSKCEIKIIGRNMQITKGMRDHIEDKIHRMEKFGSNPIEISVFLEKQRAEHKVEVIYKFSHFEIFTEGFGQFERTWLQRKKMNNMYQCIDLALSRVKRKLLKYKNRLQHHKGAASLEEVELSMQVLESQYSDEDEINEMIDEVNFSEEEKLLSPYKITKTQKKRVPMLTMQEAVMKIDFSSNKFLVFRNQEDQKIKIIYNRSEQSFGILEVE
jgi:putative sigma-54 modulation protein